MKKAIFLLASVLAISCTKKMEKEDTMVVSAATQATGLTQEEVLPTTTISSPSNSMFGGESSGGGGGFYCATNNQTEVLDLWEGQAVYGFNINRSDEEVVTQIKSALDKLKVIIPLLHDDVKEIIFGLKETAEILPAGTTLAFPHDALPDYTKEGCNLIGLMFYDSFKEAVMYEESSIQKLQSKTDEAALWVHEAIYKVLRDKFKEANSRATRRLVGCLFSDNCGEKLKTTEQIISGKKQVYQCTNATIDSEYLYFRSSSGKVGLVLTRHKGVNLKYPVYNLNTDYPFPSKQTGVFSYSDPHSMIEDGDWAIFQGLEKSQYKFYLEQYYTPHQSGGFYPIGWLGDPMDYNNVAFIGLGQTICSEYSKE